MTDVTRLLVISSNNRNCRFISNAIQRNVKSAVYKYETSTLDDILASIIAELGGIKVCSIAFMLHGTESEMYLAGIGNSILSHKILAQSQNVREFFICLSSTFMSMHQVSSRIDFLDCPIKDESEILKISQEMAKLVNCPIGISNDLHGIVIEETFPLENNRSVTRSMSVGEFYFNIQKLDELLNSSIQSQIQNLSGYEMVRTVGKGAFGTAVLYRKKDDDSLVIIKKINMHDLTANERQLAINEVSVLSMLNHENIVSYYDSFEEDGILMIEMEYADGGTLAQYLAEVRAPLEEREILSMFKQIISAIKHMHDHNILHRDLKTANIFLTKEGIVKVGDFGISKMLTTRQGGALTVVGTPYYISPEMCEGKLYNQKSDIWALGCILYEMACQQKTFEGSNLPALVNKIVKGQFAPVRGNYSSALKQLIRELLQRDPDFRPTASEILDNKLPVLMKSFEDPLNKDYDESEISMDFDFQGQASNMKSSLKQPLRSVLYDVKMYQMDISLTPVPLPPSTKIKEVSLSSTHMIVLTSELMVYTWGDGRKGQLGHGKLETWREKPFCVDALKGKNITRKVLLGLFFARMDLLYYVSRFEVRLALWSLPLICAGEGFSVFSSDNGIVMTCGNGAQGCLGHGDLNMCVKPKLIEKLLSVDVSAVSCGPHHVVIVGGEGEAYAWGCGSGGRLGTGLEEDCCSPTEVQFSSDIRVVQACCGHDGTMFVTEDGDLLACGLNDFNKLGLNEQRGFLAQMKQFISKTEVEKQLIPVKVGWLRQRVVSVSMGASHTAVLVEPGKMFTFGSNKSGQLGRGNQRTHSTPSLVKSMAGRTITMVQCGDTFTVAGTAENTIYFWGSRQVLSSDYRIPKFQGNGSKSKNRNDAEFMSEVSETSVSEVIKIGESNSPLMREIERIGPDSPIIQVKTPDSQYDDSPSPSLPRQRSTTTGSFEEEAKDRLVDSCTGRRDVILHPQEILALYASSAQIAKREIVKLMNLFCFGMQVYLVVDTTAPLPRHQSKKPKPIEHIEAPPTLMNIAKGVPVKDYSYNVPEEDSLGPIPEWLKLELANAAVSKDSTLPKPENLTGFQPTEKRAYNNANHSLMDKATQKIIKDKKNADSTLKRELEKVILEKRNTEEKLRRMEEKLSERNNKDHVHTAPNNFREKELEEEIAELRKQLKLQLPNNHEIHRISSEDVTLMEKPTPSKKKLWAQKKKTKSKSKICNIQ